MALGTSRWCLNASASFRQNDREKIFNQLTGSCTLNRTALLHRAEGLVNRFIAGKQEALFTAPDAYYRQQGGDTYK